jgi:hypothetical protein
MEKLKLVIPESWDELKLSQYIEFITTDFESLSDINKMFRVVSIMCDIDEDSISKLNLEQINMIISELEWVYIKPKYEFARIVTIDGIKYGSIPNFNNIKVGEWIDIENYIKDFKKNIHKILAIIYRPITEYHNEYVYKIEDYDSNKLSQRSDLFLEKFKVIDAINSSVFFWNFVEAYLANTTLYLEDLKMEMEADLQTITKD